jgi:hypothetical protein
MVAFTRKHLFDALESGHKLCHYFRTETLARYNYIRRSISSGEREGIISRTIICFVESPDLE